MVLSVVSGVQGVLKQIPSALGEPLFIRLKCRNSDTGVGPEECDGLDGVTRRGGSGPIDLLDVQGTPGGSLSADMMGLDSCFL